MKNFLCCILGILTVLAAGCFTPPQVTSYTNPITGLRTDLIGENLLDTVEPAREMIWLNASRVFKNRETAVYYLEVHYAARSETGFLDIDPGQSLTIVADGQEIKLAGIGSLNTRKTSDNVVHEDAIYEASATDISKLAYAAKATVKVKGQKGIVIREVSQQNFDKFKAFLDQSTTASK